MIYEEQLIRVIPPKGYDLLSYIPDVPHHGVPWITGLSPATEIRLMSPFIRGVS